MPGLLCDNQITHLALEHGMIEPFEPAPVREHLVHTGLTTPTPTGVESITRMHKVVSYGLGHYGYDMRVGNVFKVFHRRERHFVKNGIPHTETIVVDPKGIDPKCFEEIKGDCIIPANSFALAYSVERFHIPRNVLGLVIGKSTYARCGIIVNCTPMEPEWEGHLTIEISNTTPLPARIYADEGICQVLFFQGSAPCDVSYKDKGGKYDKQGAEIVLPRM